MATHACSNRLHIHPKLATEMKIAPLNPIRNGYASSFISPPQISYKK
jgi:hypothetical protein